MAEYIGIKDSLDNIYTSWNSQLNNPLTKASFERCIDIAKGKYKRQWKDRLSLINEEIAQLESIASDTSSLQAFNELRNAISHYDYIQRGKVSRKSEVDSQLTDLETKIKDYAVDYLGNNEFQRRLSAQRAALPANSQAGQYAEQHAGKNKYAGRQPAVKKRGRIWQTAVAAGLSLGMLFNSGFGTVTQNLNADLDSQLPPIETLYPQNPQPQQENIALASLQNNSLENTVANLSPFNAVANPNLIAATQPSQPKNKPSALTGMSGYLIGAAKYLQAMRQKANPENENKEPYNSDKSGQSKMMPVSTTNKEGVKSVEATELKKPANETAAETEDIWEFLDNMERMNNAAMQVRDKVNGITESYNGHQFQIPKYSNPKLIEAIKAWSVSQDEELPGRADEFKAEKADGSLEYRLQWKSSPYTNHLRETLEESERELFERDVREYRQKKAQRLVLEAKKRNLFLMSGDIHLLGRGREMAKWLKIGLAAQHSVYGSISEKDRQEAKKMFEFIQARTGADYLAEESRRAENVSAMSAASTKSVKRAQAEEGVKAMEYAETGNLEKANTLAAEILMPCVEKYKFIDIDAATEVYFRLRESLKFKQDRRAAEERRKPSQEWFQKHRKKQEKTRNELVDEWLTAHNYYSMDQFRQEMRRADNARKGIEELCVLCKDGKMQEAMEKYMAGTVPETIGEMFNESDLSLDFRNPQLAESILEKVCHYYEEIDQARLAAEKRNESGRWKKTFEHLVSFPKNLGRGLTSLVKKDAVGPLDSARTIVSNGAVDAVSVPSDIVIAVFDTTARAFGKVVKDHSTDPSLDAIVDRNIKTSVSRVERCLGFAPTEASAAVIVSHAILSRKKFVNDFKESFVYHGADPLVKLATGYGSGMIGE